MADDQELPGIARLDAAIAGGDLAAARRELVTLTPEENRVVRAELPPALAERLFATARTRSQHAKVGKVAVLHGITGSSLDAVRVAGGRNCVWINLFRVLTGQALHSLELTADGKPADPAVTIEATGLLRKWYLPLLLELDMRWDVLPVAYDWRLDIDLSAQHLADQIKRFAKGGPAHLLVHSMGGLVARRFIQLNPELWKSLDDPQGHRRGGRLIMLGTPNRGSYAIPLTLSGAETTIKILDFTDMTRGRQSVLNILNGFPGSYQMLPSPTIEVPVSGEPDHHNALFDAANWGEIPIRPDLLSRARKFQEGLDPIVDPERMLYVAGFDQPTPYGIRIDRPGEFRYKETRDGDGRVPHRLGFLPDVRNFFVRESHGDLPTNSLVLSAVHELLQEGMTTKLADRATVSRTRAAVPTESDWLPPDHFLDVDVAADVARQVDGQRVVRSRGGPTSRANVVRKGRVEEAKVESDFLDIAAGPPSAAKERRPVRGKAVSPPKQAPVLLEVEVVWGDITQTDGDVYAVGHYQGVEPQNAEFAIDWHLLSDIPAESAKKKANNKKANSKKANDKKAAKEENADDKKAGVKPGDPRLPLTRLTRNGLLQGRLGEVSLFPGIFPGSGKAITVAVAGMGYPGTFSRPRQQQLVHTLAHVVTAIPRAQILCMVLIGSGVGTLQLWEAVDGLLAGLARFAQAGGSRESRTPLRRVRIVEMALGRARELHAELVARSEAYRGALEQSGVRLAVNLQLEVSRDAEGGPTGEIKPGDALSYLLAAAMDAPNRQTTNALLHRIDLDLDTSPARGFKLISEAVDAAAEEAAATFREARPTQNRAEPASLSAAARSRPLARPRAVSDILRVVYASDVDRAPDIATRLSYIWTGKEVRVAAITNRSTVSERAASVDFDLVREQVRLVEAIDPEAEDAQIQQASRLLRRILLPRDFRPLVVSAGQIVFDVDRAMAGVPWEIVQYNAEDLMAIPERDRPDGTEPQAYLGLQIPIARQLRTTLSPPPSFEGERGGRLRALVVGDPGDRSRDESLEGARREALAVGETFSRLDVEVTLLLGAPGQSDGYPPATRSAIIDQLSRPGLPYDILHYTGHGSFDPADPTKTGWLCSDGILGPNELRLALENGAPPLVFANACLSGRPSEAQAGKKVAETHKTEFGLLPSVADIFFQFGVRNLVGTCREVNDEGATLMATAFYDQLLNSGPNAGATIGQSLLAARTRLYGLAPTFGSLWAIYHHYGNPNSGVRALASPPPDEGGPNGPQ
jgi:pimeloyl-ACP methyl ester carboxylesterase